LVAKGWRINDQGTFLKLSHAYFDRKLLTKKERCAKIWVNLRELCRVAKCYLKGSEGGQQVSPTPRLSLIKFNETMILSADIIYIVHIGGASKLPYRISILTDCKLELPQKEMDTCHIRGCGRPDIRQSTLYTEIRIKYSQKWNWAASLPISTFMFLGVIHIFPP